MAAGSSHGKRRAVVVTTIDHAVGVRSGRRDGLAVLVVGLLQLAADSPAGDTMAGTLRGEGVARGSLLEARWRGFGIGLAGS